MSHDSAHYEDPHIAKKVVQTTHTVHEEKFVPSVSQPHEMGQETPGERFNHLVEGAKQLGEKVVEKTKDAASVVADKTAEIGHKAVEATKSAAATTADKASELGHKTAQATKHAAAATADKTASMAHTVKDAAACGVEKTKDAMHHVAAETADKTASVACDVKEAAASGVERTKDTVHYAASATADKTAQAAHSARDAVASAACKTKECVRDGSCKTQDAWHETTQTAKHHTECVSDKFEPVDACAEDRVCCTADDDACCESARGKVYHLSNTKIRVKKHESAQHEPHSEEHEGVMHSAVDAVKSFASKVARTTSDAVESIKETFTHHKEEPKVVKTNHTVRREIHPHSAIVKDFTAAKPAIHAHARPLTPQEYSMKYAGFMKMPQPVCSAKGALRSFESAKHVSAAHAKSEAQPQPQPQPQRVKCVQKFCDTDKLQKVCQARCSEVNAATATTPAKKVTIDTSAFSKLEHDCYAKAKEIHKQEAIEVARAKALEKFQAECYARAQRAEQEQRTLAEKLKDLDEQEHLAERKSAEYAKLKKECAAKCQSAHGDLQKCQRTVQKIRGEQESWLKAAREHEKKLESCYAKVDALGQRAVDHATYAEELEAAQREYRAKASQLDQLREQAQDEKEHIEKLKEELKKKEKQVEHFEELQRIKAQDCAPLKDRIVSHLEDLEKREVAVKAKAQDIAEIKKNTAIAQAKATAIGDASRAMDHLQIPFVREAHADIKVPQARVVEKERYEVHSKPVVIHKQTVVRKQMPVLVVDKPESSCHATCSNASAPVTLQRRESFIDCKRKTDAHFSAKVNLARSAAAKAKEFQYAPSPPLQPDSRGIYHLRRDRCKHRPQRI